MTEIFNIFPEEIWEDILEKITDSKDILNMVEAYPELKILCRGKEYSLLVGDILPLLIPKYLSISCFPDYRLVSKRWNNAISNILETHPDRLPYKSSKLKKISENHFNYHKLPNISTNLANFVYKIYRDHEIIKSESLFPGGHVSLNVESSRGYEDPYEWFYVSTHNRLAFNIEFRQAFPSLQIYGHLITSLHITLGSISQLDSETFSGKTEYPWPQCLSCLPRLKALKITGLTTHSGNIVGKRRKQLLKFISQAEYPFQLETLDLSEYRPVTEYADINHSFVLSLASCNQIQKLVFRVDLWKSEYGTLFQNLCDLQVQLTDLAVGRFTELDTILMDLRCSPIRKVKITTSWINICNLLSSFVGYNVEFLEIVGKITEIPVREQDIENKGSFSRFKNSVTSLFARNAAPSHNLGKQTKDKGMVPSIKYLRLTMDTRTFLWFDFLDLLPSLENLTIDAARYWVRLAEDLGSFRECLINIYCKSKPDPKYVLSLWNDFLNFGKLALHSACTRQFVKESKKATVHYRIKRNP